jgi:glycosyltransferase involved in cell wall biosynthesis
MEERIPHTMYVTISLHGGGAERLLTNLLLQHNEPERISVVTLLSGGVFRRPLEDAGISVTDLGMRRNRDVVRGAFALARLIRALRPSAVYGWMYHANILASVAALLAGRPRPRVFWGIFCTDCCGKGSALMLRLVRAIGGLLSRWVSGVIYNAQEARDYHHRIGYCAKRSLVISNCIDPDVFHHDPQQREAFRAELAIGPADIVVAMVARVDPMKDWDTMREAVRNLPGVVTVAIGLGTDKLPPQAGFIGLGWRDDVVPVLSAADIFLLGSAYGEGASLALGEAMLCGLPCIVTDVGGNASLAGDGGIVVEPRNPAAIRKAVLQLANDRVRRAELGRTARARAATSESRVETFQRLDSLSRGTSQ